MLAFVARQSWRKVQSFPTLKTFGISGTRAYATDTKDGGSDRRSGKNTDGDEDEDEDDEFGLEGFDLEIDKDEDDAVAKLDALSKREEDITPELASELVQKIVESSADSVGKPGFGKAEIISAVTPHTISVMRASRVSTNAVHAAGSEKYPYPVIRKVSGQINVAQLGLSRPAEEVLKILAGPRVKGNLIKFSSEKFPSMEENRAHIVSLLHRLVAAAKISVGEEVDNTSLESWEDVAAEVRRQAPDEIAEAGGDSVLLLGEEKSGS